MKLIYKGEFDGNPESLPHNEHMPNATMFKEFTDMKKFAIVINVASGIILIIMIVIFSLVSGGDSLNFIGVFIAVISMVPHEILHAVCFKKEVYFYTNLRQGMMFVYGKEHMSKAHFVIMSMMPNLVFGFIPFILFLINNDWTLLGSMGAFAIGMGAGDYYNVFNAITQMPKGAKAYMYGMNTYWYMPQSSGKS